MDCELWVYPSSTVPTALTSNHRNSGIWKYLQLLKHFLVMLNVVVMIECLTVGAAHRGGVDIAIIAPLLDLSSLDLMDNVKHWIA